MSNNLDNKKTYRSEGKQSKKFPDREESKRFNKLIEFFRENPSALENGCQNLEMRATHISAVFLSADFVYKFKKPVTYKFISQGQLSRRIKHARQEVELNSRLSPEVYPGVMGVFSEGEEGESYTLRDNLEGAVEVCVKMIRLPDEQNLLHRLDRRPPDEKEIRAIARTIADFHVAHSMKFPTREKSGRTSKEARFYFKDNFLETLEVLYSSGRVKRSFLGEVYKYFKNCLPRLETRVRRNGLVDGHGDLRPEHIYLSSADPDASSSEKGLPGGEVKVQIIDCVEFNPTLRIQDPLEDLAFLTMSLKIKGQEQAAERLLCEYISWTGDCGGLDFFPLFEIYRASVRAKVDLMMLMATGRDKEQYYEQRFGLYIDFIKKTMKTTLEPSPPEDRRVIVFMGLPASGKSEQARHLCEKSPKPILSTDLIRKRMFAHDPIRPPGEKPDLDLYKDEISRRVYRRQRALARLCLRSGRNVILDGVFLKEQDRRRVIAMAQKAGATPEFRLVETSEQIIEERLKNRQTEGGVSDLDNLETWRGIRDRFEEMGEEVQKYASSVPGETDSFI